MVIGVADECDIDGVFLKLAAGLIAQHSFYVRQPVLFSLRCDVVEHLLVDVNRVELRYFWSNHLREQSGPGADVSDNHRRSQFASVDNIFPHVEYFTTFAFKSFNKRRKILVGKIVEFVVDAWLDAILLRGQSRRQQATASKQNEKQAILHDDPRGIINSTVRILSVFVRL